MALQLQAEQPWANYKVKVESWYQKAPEFRVEQELDFVGVPLTPIVDLEKAFTSHDKADTVISGQVGLSKGQSLVFDPAGMGAWQVFVREEKSDTPIGVPVAVGPDGAFTINLGRLSAGTRYIVAEAKMVDGTGLISNSSVVSKTRALVTAVGDNIEATLSSRSTSGKAPFVQTINANLKNSKMLSSVKAVSWERQKADGGWERVMRNDTTEYVGVNYTATVAEVGKANYRAVLINKYSGAEYVTEPITLHAFAVPSFSIKAPGVVQVNRPVTLEVQADQGFEASYIWKMITSGGYTEVSGETGKSFSFTPTELKNYVVEVSGRAADAPDNPAANVTKTVGVKAVNPLAARASITGPTYLEAGKTYSYKATINDVVPTGSSKAYKVLGYWMLPDGTRVEGTELSFTPRTGDTALSYYTYVEGYPEETTVATLGFKAWTYTWPTNWRIRLQPTLLDVPALVKYYVEAPDFDLKTLNGEPLTYTWALPQDVARTSGTDTAGTLTIGKNGSYQLAVQVADTRGNVVNVLSDEFTILPAASVKTQASIVSKYGAAYYAPGTYYVSLRINEMPRGDSFLRNEVLINGAKVGEFTGSGNYVSFADAGTYEVAIRTITKAGNYGEQAMTVPVSAAPVAQCEIKQASTTSGVLITPLCTVPVGYIKTLTWTYRLDGTEQKATSKSFLVTKDWIANSRVRDLLLTIETDLGAISTVPVAVN
ncbi:PKD domain-containing protein [Acidovorax sp. sic0104]|nr:PKD domain-containing protein [Acidovorax sp. sic0104]